jgi:hypothetical protein
VFENHDPETSGRWFYELIGEIIQEVFEKNHENPETSGRWFYELLAPVIQEHIALYHVRGRHTIPNG